MPPRETSLPPKRYRVSSAGRLTLRLSIILSYTACAVPAGPPQAAPALPPASPPEGLALAVSPTVLSPPFSVPLIATATKAKLSSTQEKLATTKAKLSSTQERLATTKAELTATNAKLSKSGWLPPERRRNTYAARNTSKLAKRQYRALRIQQFDKLATDVLQIWDLEDGRDKLSTSAIFPGVQAREKMYRTPNRQWLNHQMHQLGKAGLGGSGAHCLDWGTMYINRFNNCAHRYAFLYQAGVAPFIRNETRKGTVSGGSSSGSVPLGTAIILGDATLPAAVSAKDRLDLIICTMVFEHIHKPWLALPVLRDMLKPGGALVFTVPFMFGFHEVPGDFWRYTWQGVVTLLMENGFTVCALATDGPRSVLALQLNIMNLPLSYLTSPNNALYTAGLGGRISRLGSDDGTTIFTVALKGRDRCHELPDLGLSNVKDAASHLHPQRWKFNPLAHLRLDV